MDRCPACRARLADGPVCPRCGCDYSLANRAETQARRLARRAVRAWAEGDPAAATACIDESLALRRDRLAEALAVVLGSTQAESIREA